MDTEATTLPRALPCSTPQGSGSARGAWPVRSLLVLVLILAVGAGVRFALWAQSEGHALTIYDERSYNTLAVNLVTHGEFAFTPGTPVSLRPPLYPAVVAGLYRLLGLENYQAVRLFQALLSLGLVVVMYRIGAAVCSPRVGLGLAGFCCFYPTLLGYNNLLLTEVLFTFLLCAFCGLVLLALVRGSLLALAAAGVVLGLAALTRSVLWLFPPVLAVFLLIAFTGTWWRRLLAAVTVVAAFAATIAPWAARNTLLHRTFIAIDVMGGRNFMMGNYRYTPLYRSWATIEIQGEESWHHEVESLYPQEEWDTQGKKDKLALRQGLKFVLANPWLTLERDLVKFFDFWGVERELIAGAESGYFGTVSRPVLLLLTFVIAGSYVFALLAGVFGVFLAPPGDRRVHLFLLLVIAFLCGMHTLSFAHSRYHLPIMPLVFLYATSALVNARAVWQARRRWAFRVACGVCAVFIGGWVWLLVAVDGERILRMLSLA